MFEDGISKSRMQWSPRGENDGRIRILDHGIGLAVPSYNDLRGRPALLQDTALKDAG